MRKTTYSPLRRLGDLWHLTPGCTPSWLSPFKSAVGSNYYYFILFFSDLKFNLETEPCLSPFGSLRRKTKKKKGSFRRTQALGTWHLDTGKLAPWDWVLRLELPFSFPKWNSSLLSPLTCAKKHFCCCQVVIQPRYRQPSHPSLFCRMNLQIIIFKPRLRSRFRWLYLRWQGQENTSLYALWQRARSLKFNQNSTGWVRYRILVWVAWITKWIYDFKSTRWFRENREEEKVLQLFIFLHRTGLQMYIHPSISCVFFSEWKRDSFYR